MSSLPADIRYGFRALRRSPGFVFAALTALTLGIGANSAIFSVVNTVLLRPLPYPEPDRLGWLFGRDTRRNVPSHHILYPDFVQWRDQSRSYDAATAFTPQAMTLTAPGADPERLDGWRVNAAFLRVLRVNPQLGRGFLEEEDKPGARRVALISHALWQRRFGADKSVIGRQILLDNNQYTVIGVLPPRFKAVNADNDFYVPMALDPARVGPGAGITVGGLLRLKRGVSLARAQAETDGILPSLNDRFFGNSGRNLRLWGAREFVVRDVKTSLMVLLGAVALLLLIACANVANLLLARSGARQREMAIRAAMGAGRMRIVRQLLTESLLLGAAGGALGLAVAWGGVKAITAAGTPRFPMLADTRVDVPVVGFTLAVALATGLIFGVAPAISAARTAVHDALKEGGRSGAGGARGNRLRNTLVVAEVTLALVLAISAGLLIRAFGKLVEVNPGFKARGVLTAGISLPAVRYPKPEQRVLFFRRLVQELEARPAVQAAGLVSQVPLGGANSGRDVHFEGRPVPRVEDAVIAWFRSASPAYFRAMQIPLVRGRIFGEQDMQPGRLVAVVNETFARRYYPNEDPIGKRFGYAGGRPPGRDPIPPRWMEIVGVAGDVRHSSLAQPPEPEYFAPFWQEPVSSLHAIVRTGLQPEAFAPELRAVVRAIDKDQAISEVRSMERIQRNSVSERRLSVWLLGIFAAVALALAAVGIYGVISFSVERRTHEIGIRAALGATRADVLRMVLLDGLRFAGLGLVLGLAAAFSLTRVLRSILFGVTATDPLVFAGSTAVLAAVAALAAYIPARRATRVDPVVALRYE